MPRKRDLSGLTVQAGLRSKPSAPTIDASITSLGARHESGAGLHVDFHDRPLMTIVDLVAVGTPTRLHTLAFRDDPFAIGRHPGLTFLQLLNQRHWRAGAGEGQAQDVGDKSGVVFAGGAVGDGPARQSGAMGQEPSGSTRECAEARKRSRCARFAIQ